MKALPQSETRVWLVIATPQSLANLNILQYWRLNLQTELWELHSQPETPQLMRLAGTCWKEGAS